MQSSVGLKKKTTKQRNAVRYVTVGSKGTFCWSARADADGDLLPVTNELGESFEDAGFVLYGKQAQGELVRLEWKGKQGDSLLGKAIGAWCSNAGGKVRILPVDLAVRKGLVQRYTLTTEQGDEIAYLPPDDYETVKFPIVMGTDNREGGIETYLAKNPDRQGGRYRAEVALK